MLKGVVNVCCVEEIIDLQFMCFEGRQKTTCTDNCSQCVLHLIHLTRENVKNCRSCFCLPSSYHVYLSRQKKDFRHISAFQEDMRVSVHHHPNNV